MKPSLPLTSITRQLKEVGETREETDSPALPSSLALYTSTGTLTRSQTRKKSTNFVDESPNTGTLKRYNNFNCTFLHNPRLYLIAFAYINFIIISRQHSYKSSASMESMGSKNGSSSPLCGITVRENNSPFGDRNISFINRSASSDTMKGPISPSANKEVPSCMVSKLLTIIIIMYSGFYLTIYELRN